MKFEVKGKILVAGERKSGFSVKTQKTWSSQDCVIELEDMYPEKVFFTHYMYDVVLKEGDVISMDMRISCREYNGKYYNQVYGSNISIEGTTSRSVDIGKEVAAGADAIKSDDLPF